MDAWTSLPIAVFVFVYAGMMLGGIPGLALDRTGVAILGALVLVGTGRISLQQALGWLDVPTLALLFGLMVVSAQFRIGGFYAKVTGSLAGARVSPRSLLALLILTSGALSAVLANDIVCLAMTPLLVRGCLRRSLDPKPFLMALACSSNVGSAATLIGNPQNMLIGQALDLSFSRYLLDAGIPSLLGLGAVWLVIAALQRGRWRIEGGQPAVEAKPAGRIFDAWQTVKGSLVLAAVMVLFLASSWPREIVALGAAAILLASRHTRSREMLGLVDWQLLVLFMGLFVVNGALSSTGATTHSIAWMRSLGMDPSHPAWLFGITVALSNLVSNVPATMLLLPAATHPLAGPVLALSSTLAGNLIVVGSIANIIVVEEASRMGVRISWREHARTGVPVTAATLAIAAAWLLGIWHLDRG